MRRTAVQPYRTALHRSKEVSNTKAIVVDSMEYSANTPVRRKRHLIGEIESGSKPGKPAVFLVTARMAASCVKEYVTRSVLLGYGS